MTVPHARRLRPESNVRGEDLVPHRLGVLMEHVCDAHVRPDPRGPLITLLDGRWAYCAGHGSEGHRWREVAPIERGVFESTQESVTFICGSEEHVRRGFDVPDGHGFLTVTDHSWAYCGAAMDETHDWRPVEAIEFRDIRHREIPRLIAGKQ